MIVRFVGGLLAAALPTVLAAQAVASRNEAATVAVVINDSAAKRVFTGAFTSAFRALGDVRVVSTAERPQYVLSGVVMCEPASCDSPASYSAALRLWSPVPEATARRLAIQLVPFEPRETFASRVDSATRNVLWPELQFFEQSHSTWTVTWGRQRYEQAIREMVREIDSDCFERHRAFVRAYASPDTAVTNAIRRMIYSRQWLC